MADRGYIPSSPECGRWETLLADALDGRLRPEDESAFTGHMAICPACATLFEEASRGREWLEFLSPEPDIPEGLFDRILAQTGPDQVAGYGLLAEGVAVPAMPQSWPPPGFAGPGFAGRVRRYAEPRLLMTVAMAFFSIALTLNLVGFKFTEVRLSALRPTAVRSLLTRRIVTASIPFLRYYDHLRFLYEVESSMPQVTSSEGQSEPDPTPAGPISAAPGFSQKGAAFSPYVTEVALTWALQAANKPPLEGGGGFNPRISSAEPVGFSPGGLLERSSLLATGPFSAASTYRSWARLVHSGSSTTRASEGSRLWTA